VILKILCKDGELIVNKQTIIERISAELAIPVQNVTNTVALLGEGNTVPFIAR
jgi:transcriptional accessory protein Tex/SPT6